MRFSCFCVVGGVVFLGSPAIGMGIFGNTGLGGGFRWDAAPRTIGGLERSLAGGLRFSVTGGGYQAFRDQFVFQGGPPSVAAFTQVVNDAFNAWTVVDPATGLNTAISFTPDLATPVNTAIVSGVRQGAEIDVFAFNFGDAGTRGDTFFSAAGTAVTLTSGTANYPGSVSISGADIRINSNPGAVYSLDVFRLLLTHEIGHALGLADVDANSGPNGTFIDDNYNGATNATALATLTNSWARRINATNPAATTGVQLYTVAAGQPGIATPGVNILMESFGLGGQFGNLTPMANDDYAGRQFLYPSLTAVPARWINSAGGTWPTGGNWDIASAPQPSRDAQFDINNVYQVQISTGVSAFNVNVDRGVVEFAFNNGSLLVNGNLNVGRITGQASTLVINSNATNNVSIAGVVNVQNGSVLRLGTGKNKVLSASGITTGTGGRIDLFDNGLIVNHSGTPSPLASIRSQIVSAYNGGSWNGSGIGSFFLPLTAGRGIGYAEASDVLGAAGGTFFGQNVDGTTVLVRYTLLGDANLDGTVNIGDFSRLASAFNTAGGWSMGDFDYNNMVNITDFSSLASNFNQVLPRSAAVPEPSGFVALALGVAALRRRRS